jgi:hypothetical protein
MEKLLGAVEQWQADYNSSSEADDENAVQMVNVVTAEQRAAAARAAAVDLCDSSGVSSKKRGPESEESVGDGKKAKTSGNDVADGVGAKKRITLVGDRDFEQLKRFKASEAQPRFCLESAVERG